MEKQNESADDFEFVGYVSWVEECGLFFIALAATGSLIWLGWWIGKSAGFWS